MIDDAFRAISGVSIGTPMPAVSRLLVGADGSFGLAASDWRVPGHDRWDLFTADGDYLGGVTMSAASRGVGVEQGTLWYVRFAGDSIGGAPTLVRVRPAPLSPAH
jgi:hypothetical protein